MGYYFRCDFMLKMVSCCVFVVLIFGVNARAQESIRTSIFHQFSKANKFVAFGVVSSQFYAKDAAIAVASTNSLENIYLKKPIFNFPPTEQHYPPFLSGIWKAEMKYQRAAFCPAFTMKQLASDLNIPGFRKYSVVFLPDIGADATTFLRFENIQRPLVAGPILIEDIKTYVDSIFTSQYATVASKVDTFDYDPAKNPNRISLLYHDTKGTGAIELFVNSRSSSVSEDGKRFFSLAHVRQSSVRRSNERAASQTIGDYAIEWDLTSTASIRTQATPSRSPVVGTFRVYSYLQPQDPLYFDRPDLPVALFEYTVALTPVDSIPIPPNVQYAAPV